MILYKTAAELHNWLESQRKNKRKIGFVPTMGALHPGHISLIESSRKENPVTVCSIFVNPTQFNDPKDFEKYPITIEQDITQLEQAGADLLFLPSVQEMYPHGLKPARHYELGFLETVFDGAFRPGHFQGVCMVVHRLLEIVQPDNLYLGQKDYQQCMVISELIRLIGMQDKTRVRICPTLREPDGLAMSSRNLRLSPEERKIAPGIYHTLLYIKDNLEKGSLDSLQAIARQMLEKSGFRVDYISVVDAKDLSAVDHWDGEQKLVVLAAAFLNEVRLIDNMLLN